MENNPAPVSVPSSPVSPPPVPRAPNAGPAAAAATAATRAAFGEDERRNGADTPRQGSEAECSPRGRDPAFLFYSADFLAATYQLRDSDAGRLIRLLCMQHQRGHLGERDFLRVVRNPDAPVAAFFRRDEDGRFYNEKLERDITKRREYTASRIRNLAGGKKSDTPFLSETHMGGHMPPHMENRNRNENENENENRYRGKKRRDAGGVSAASGPTAENIERMEKLLARIKNAPE